MIYKRYYIYHNPKPIPSKIFDWDYEHVDYDGAPDSLDYRAGSGKSESDCKQQIDQITGD